MIGGAVLLVSGPSGSGKTTLCRRLVEEGEAHYSISCTTRQPRKGERTGVDYYFLSVDEFKEKVSKGELLEWAEVHGNYYGTLKSQVLDFINQGKDVVMDIDVQGADLVRACDDVIIQKALVDLFVIVEDHEELYKRLSGRATDSEEVIALRMKNSIAEMSDASKYRFLLKSADHETDYGKFKSLLTASRLRQQ